MDCPGAFQKDKASGVDVVFQFDISGPKGGGLAPSMVKEGSL